MYDRVRHVCATCTPRARHSLSLKRMHERSVNLPLPVSRASPPPPPAPPAPPTSTAASASPPRPRPPSPPSSSITNVEFEGHVCKKLFFHTFPEVSFQRAETERPSKPRVDRISTPYNPAGVSSWSDATVMAIPAQMTLSLGSSEPSACITASRRPAFREPH